MARLSDGFDPYDLNATIEQVQEKKEKLGHFQENWGLYSPIVIGVATIAGLYAMKSKNKKFKTWYDNNYPLINGLSMMVPAYFSWQTIKLRKIEKQINEKQQGTLGGFQSLSSLLNRRRY